MTRPGGGILSCLRSTGQAQRVGALVFLTLILTSGLFAAPALATDQDFGHRHSDGTPFHLHAIAGILSGDVAHSAPAVTVALITLFFVPLGRRAEYREKVLCRSRAIRAPPAAD